MMLRRFSRRSSVVGASEGQSDPDLRKAPHAQVRRPRHEPQVGLRTSRHKGPGSLRQRQCQGSRIGVPDRMGPPRLRVGLVKANATRTFGKRPALRSSVRSQASGSASKSGPASEATLASRGGRNGARRRPLTDVRGSLRSRLWRGDQSRPEPSQRRPRPGLASKPAGTEKLHSSGRCHRLGRLDYLY